MKGHSIYIFFETAEKQNSIAGAVYANGLEAKVALGTENLKKLQNKSAVQLLDTIIASACCIIRYMYIATIGYLKRIAILFSDKKIFKICLFGKY